MPAPAATSGRALRAAIYARVSTREGQDTSNQLRPLREFAAAMNYEPAGEYIDTESGGTSDRPAFRRMFEDARLRRFDLVLFWSLDRLSREGAYATLEHLRNLTAAGVDWRSYTEQYLDSTGLFRDAIISILATLARQERIRIQERTRAGIDRARKEGKPIGRPAHVVDLHKLEGLAPLEAAKLAGVSVATIRRRRAATV